MKKEIIALPQNGLGNRLAHISTVKIFAEEMGYDYSIAWNTLNLFLESPYPQRSIPDLDASNTLFVAAHFTPNSILRGDPIYLFFNYGCYNLSREEGLKYFTDLGFPPSVLNIDEVTERITTENHVLKEILPFFERKDAVVIQGWNFAKALYGPTGLNTHSSPTKLNAARNAFYSALSPSGVVRELAAPYENKYFENKNVLGIQVRGGDLYFQGAVPGDPQGVKTWDGLLSCLQGGDLKLWASAIEAFSPYYDHIFICSDSIPTGEYLCALNEKCFSFSHSFKRDGGSTGCYWNDIESNDLINHHPPTNLIVPEHEPNAGNCKKTMCAEDFAVWYLLSQCDRILFSGGSSFGYEAAISKGKGCRNKVAHAYEFDLLWQALIGGKEYAKEISPDLSQTFPLSF